MNLHRTTFRWRHRGFSLTELLVVIGIIVAVAAIALPMALRAYKNVNKTRTQADLQAIAAALNYYKQDFGDYPRISEKSPTIGVGWNIGAAVLCKALVGPYGDGLQPNSTNNDTQDPPPAGSLSEIKLGQCVNDGGMVIALVDDPLSNYGDPTKWAPFSPRDGADGPGFRLRQIAGQAPQGKVWGPYLQAEKFNVVGCMMNDREGNPVLYFPAATGASNIRSQVQEGTTNVMGYVDRSLRSLYDARDGLIFFRRETETDDTNALRAIRVMLGDFIPWTGSFPNTNADGKIDPNETPASEAPFLLWTAGPDGLFGPVRGSSSPWNPTKRDIERCDDITNFTP